MIMEELLNVIDKSCSISSEHDLLFKRKSQFKCIGKTQESSREKRRMQLIEDYKRKREALLDEKRGLIDDEFKEDVEWMDWQEGKKRSGRRCVNFNCRNQLMLSEWLMDRPSDLETDWTCVICPQGRRTLVVAKRGCTRAYHKSGLMLAKFKSVLPNGAPFSRGHHSQVIILDCIWNETTKQLYALDVLHWKNHTLLNCDAQFRLYWLKSKLTEVKLNSSEFLTAEASKQGVYDVFLPTHCSLASLPQSLADHEASEVDGVLFYHNNAPYISGRTPLVGWLKPYMLPDKIGLQVPESYVKLRPEQYESLEQWVASVSHSHKRKPRRNKNSQKMDTSGTEESESVSSSSTCEMNCGNQLELATAP